VFYLWSRGGQTTEVRLEARGSDFVAYVDGRLVASAHFDGPDRGGFVLTFDDPTDIPSLPTPRGADAVRVTDLASGQVLFEDGFSSGLRPEWTVFTGTFERDDGVLHAAAGGEIGVVSQRWRDYAVDLTYRNLTGGVIMLRAQDSGNGVAYRFRPPGTPFPLNEFAFMEDGQVTQVSPGEKIELRRSETIRALVAMALNPYPLTLLLLCLGGALVFAGQFVKIPDVTNQLRRVSPSLTWGAAGAMAGVAFGLTLFLNATYGARMPHVPDEVAYIFQAKLLASGHLSAQQPPVPEVFDFFYQPLIDVSDGRWASVYPLGHPLALAIGVKLHAIWLIPPLLGAACVLLIFAVGRRLYGDRIGLLAALLMVTSPFFLMTASNFMSHNTATFYLLASLLFVVMIDKRPFLYGLLAGLFFGLVFNTRPLTGIALIPPFAVLLLSLLWPRDRWQAGARQVGGFLVGGLIMLGAFLLYSYGTTGNALTGGYQTSADFSDVVGFSGEHSVDLGIQNEHIQMATLLLVLNGWPRYVGLMFVLLPFVLGTRNRWDWFFLASAVSVMGAYTLWGGEVVLYGPRYWYEAMPFFLLLTARGADRAAAVLADAARWLNRTMFESDRRPFAVAVVAVYALVFVLMGGALYTWLLGQRDNWEVTFVPERATGLEGFMGVDDRLVRLADDADLQNALVLVEDCAREEGLGIGWPCFGSVFWLNSPELDGNVVFVRDVEGRREDIMRAFPGRTVYVATYRSPSLVPYSAPAAGARDDGG
jgi:4-amino-4-deoxy-L-arabinose transferase-like glycosyltransferase